MCERESFGVEEVIRAANEVEAKCCHSCELGTALGFKPTSSRAERLTEWQADPQVEEVEPND